MRHLTTSVVLLVVLAGCAPVVSPTPSSPTAAPSPTPAPATLSPLPGETPLASVDAAGVGRAFVDALARGDTATAEGMEDDTMRTAAPAAVLAQLWQQFVGQFGAFAELGEVTTEPQPPYTNVIVQASFANDNVPLIVTVDTNGRVAGLHLGTPVPAASPAPPASYVHPDAFTERDVTVGSAPWVLPGTLAMPVGRGPFPAVVLVAGSGPVDRNETIGPNAPLRDIAWGLASAGIAVLRYDKRTKAYPSEMAADAAKLTVREEVTDDAVAAIQQLRATQGVDPDRVFLVGHSLGGYLAPRIAAQAPQPPAGIGLLEANSSPLPQLILDQVEYLAAAQGSPSPEASDQLATLRAQVALAESPDLSPSTPPSALPLGVPAAYWLDLRTYDPLATAASLDIPMFFAQGGRDYQVPPSELEAWRAALAGHADVAFHEYPALNHLMMAGSGSSLPAEYNVPGHVAPALVADLAAWIEAH